MRHYVIREAGAVVACGQASEADFSAGLPPGLEWVDAPYRWPRAAVELDLALVLSAAVVAVGQPVDVTADLTLGGAPAPIDQTFAVPIEDAAGRVVAIRGVQFVAGHATVTLTFGASGYYRITEQGINSRLTGLYIRLAGPVEVVVYE